MTEETDQDRRVRFGQEPGPAWFGEEPDAQDNYGDFVAHLVEAALKRDPSPAEYVANHVIVSTYENYVDDDVSVFLEQNGRPYIESRVYPYQVLHGAGGHSQERADSVREVAVNTLVRDMREYAEKHGLDWE